MNTKGSRMVQRLRSLIAPLSFALALVAGAAQGAGSDWTRPFTPDEHTVVLYHFDEASGDETHDALGDQELTLRAKRALWGKRTGFGSTARFERRPDDANVLVGPVNNDKLHLRGCTREWTIEAWVRYTGPGGEDGGHTYANIAGTEDEGFGLPLGFRGGWNFSLHNREGALADGLGPSARFMGSPRGKDPNHDTSGLLFPYYRGGGHTGAEPARITDNRWHHVAWQFRYRDQTHFFFLDGKVVRKVQLPFPGHQQGKVVNDAIDVVVPFVVGGIIHSQDPPFYLEYGSFEGDIDELRISSIMRYPVARELAIVRETLSKAGLNLPYTVPLGTDAAAGKVSWKLLEGKLPQGLTLDNSGTIQGRPVEAVADRKVTIRARDSEGNGDKHTFAITVAPGEVVTESLPPAFAGSDYRLALESVHTAEPLRWKVVSGSLPEGMTLKADTGLLAGAPTSAQWARFTVQATDANELKLRRELVLKVMPQTLRTIEPDPNTVVLYDWQGPNGRLIEDRMGDKDLTLTWTNMGGDRRVFWPGREGRFPQFVGHGEHGFVITGKGNPKLDLKTCNEAWTVEAWVRRGGPFRAHGDRLREHNQPFDYGHIMGSYDNTKRGVWELYLSDGDSPDGNMAVGVHFLGAEPDQALMDLHPWKRPDGIVGNAADVGIGDTEWHHVAWQYNYADDLHQLFLDGKLIWRMKSPDGRKLVNNREHDAQFSVTTRLAGYAKYGGEFNYLGFGNFFGQIGEIRISNVLRYGRTDRQ